MSTRMEGATAPMARAPSTSAADTASAGRASAAPAQQGREPHRFIYLAGPCTPMGGGMFKVAEYLVQSQRAPAGAPVLRLLETRGGGSAAGTLVHLPKAIAALVRGRLSGQLAGVHVNVAERLSLLRKGVLVAASRLLGLPVVLHLHAAQLHHSYRALPAPARALVRWMFSMPDTCVVLGRGAAEFVTQELNVPAQRVEIVINGVPEPQVPRRVPVAGAVQKLLFLGNLSERKGVSDLLQALAQPLLAQVPLQLTLAGGGDVAGYAALADRLGLGQRVRFHGWADGAAVAQLLAESDVMVLPSYDEGLPLAILEALAHGVAVVCTPVGEIPHVLADGENACFVAPGDPASIARGLARVLCESGLRERLERNGRAVWEQRFSLARFAASVARIHQRQFGTSAWPPGEPRP